MPPHDACRSHGSMFWNFLIKIVHIMELGCVASLRFSLTYCVEVIASYRAYSGGVSFSDYH